MKKENTIKLYNPDFVLEIKQIVTQARQKAYAAINSAMVDAYWQMGKRIVEQEQFGKERADYGAQLLKSLSKELTAEFGKGFSVNSLYYFRQFYLAFPEKLPTLWGILTWSHYKRLLSVSNADARAWYLKEAVEQMWSYRTLDRNIGSQYYERLLLSQHKDTVESEMKTLTKPFEQDRMEFIKNPTVAEFIGLAPNSDFSETELEGAIIGNLQKFLLELGKGFSFVARQKLIRTEKKDYFIDLVFYNYILKSFVLIDLKRRPSPTKTWDRWICTFGCTTSVYAARATIRPSASSSVRKRTRTSPVTPCCTTTTACSPRNTCFICLRRRSCGRR